MFVEELLWKVFSSMAEGGRILIWGMAKSGLELEVPPLCSTVPVPSYLVSRPQFSP